MFSFCKKWKGRCTCFLDKLFNKDWSECCKQHDEDYESLKELRAAEYPPMEEYIDAIVKGDTEAAGKYKRKCLEVKAKYPRDLV